MSSGQTSLITSRPPGLVDVLDRILDKGLVIAGDIKISLANVELLTLQIRLLVCSIDKAEQIGLNWWRYDRNLAPGTGYVSEETVELRRRIVELEKMIEVLNPRSAAGRPGVSVRGESKKTKANRKPRGGGTR